MSPVNIGIIGGGLMGREMASAFARWCALTDVSVRPVLTAVADLNPATLSWFDCIPSCTQKTTDYKALLANPDVDVVYVAVPHNLHEQLYCDVLAAGKDLFAEKPFGIDLASARRIHAAAKASGRFVRCSSEMPFFPGAQRAFELAVACKTNEALLDTDAAERSGGPGSSLAGVERIIILQEAGRPATAAGARDVYIGKLGDDKARIEELDRNVASGVAKLRSERKARTGKEEC